VVEARESAIEHAFALPGQIAWQRGKRMQRC